MLLGTGLGSITDPDGNYRLSGLPPGSYDVSVSMLGYAPELRRRIQVPPTGSVHLEVGLRPTALDLLALVVSASKRPRSFVDAPTSVSLISSEDLESHNAISLDESLDTVPGVHMVSGQVNVRGSSGYSRGTGSRVLLLIDGFPALSADNGEVKWDAIPMDQIQRVEVIKGAGSALYGTGALGG
ncbi:MAG: TonB-dependent receptor plug domain-containing protein, partial [Candidatus Latescibacteria bacterium]|nr:TonB-dependent receptor plug domain-containing protein [Candidatus Latescibacterota bacterium]